MPVSTPGDEHPWDPFGPNLIVIVGHGSDEAVFTVSASLLCHYSGYFSMLCNDPFLGAPTMSDEIRLPGDTAEIFGMVHFYLQTRRFLFDNCINPAKSLTFDKIIDLYAYSVKRNIPITQNAAADLFAEKIKLEKTLPDRWSLEYLWERTEVGAPLRSMIVDLVREMWIPDGHRNAVWEELVGGKSESPERLSFAIEELGRSKHQIRISGKTTKRLLSCEWHVHELGVFCEGSEEFRLPRGEPDEDLAKFSRRQAVPDCDF